MPRYIMLDHGGVLEGTLCLPKEVSQTDLVISETDFGYVMVLRSGLTIIDYLTTLIRDHDFLLVFHSKNKAEQQIELLTQLRLAARKYGHVFPPVYAMAVRDPERYVGVSSEFPQRDLIGDGAAGEGIIMAGYGDDLDGKACVRQALSSILDIKADDRFCHIVCDDGPGVIEQARREGYRAYLIGDGSDAYSLLDVLEKVLRDAEKVKRVGADDDVTDFKMGTF